METITHYLSDDHVHCDDLFAEAENVVAGGDWTAAAAAFASFRTDTLRHLAREEEVLFPAFEARTGMTAGPTMIMREEHTQMREVLDAMAQAVEQHDGPGYLGLSETLLMLMRQHNMKEERILYPMADQALNDEQAEVISRMGAL